MSTLCPLCKSETSVVYGYRTVFVECTSKACHWTQSPLPELIKEVAVATWHRANPTPPRPIDHAFEDIFGFLDDECSVVVDEDPDSVTRCGKPADAHAPASGMAA